HPGPDEARSVPRAVVAHHFLGSLEVVSDAKALMLEIGRAQERGVARRAERGEDHRERDEEAGFRLHFRAPSLPKEQTGFFSNLSRSATKPGRRVVAFGSEGSIESGSARS